MQSSWGRAASSRPESGAEITGLPQITTRALIWPSPGVSISSARHDSGTWPITSGAPRTRLVQRPISTGSSRGRRAIDQATGLAHISPPSRSRLPVRAQITSGSHEARVPNSWLQVPMRAYHTALSAAANRRARPRMDSGSVPQAAATRSGPKSADSRRTSSTPLSRPAR